MPQLQLLLQMVLKEAQDRDASFNGLKMIIGGSRLTEGLAKTAMSQGIEVYTGYGMSETAPLISLTEFSLNEPEMTEDETKRRVKSVTFPNAPGAYIKINGETFLHENILTTKPTPKPWNREN